MMRRRPSDPTPPHDPTAFVADAPRWPTTLAAGGLTGMAVHLTTLGDLSVRSDDADDGASLAGQPALVFAYLVDRGAPQPRSELGTLFWPDSDPVRARHGLRQALSRIRKTLGPEIVRGTDPVGVHTEAVTWDVDDFQSALERADVATALDLCRGPYLHGAAEGASWELQEWIERRRRELQAMLLDVGRGAVRALVQAEDFEAALDLVDRVEACVPGDRGLAVDAAEVLVELGRPHEAAARLEGAGVDGTHPRVAGLLKRARRTQPEVVEPLIPVPEAPEAATAPPREPRSPSRGRLLVGAIGAVALAAVLIGFLRPAPLGDVSIWFCAERETQYGFVLELPERSLDGVSTEPGCPIMPLGEDSVLVIRGDGEPEMRLELETSGRTRVVYRALRIQSRIPFRRAGRQDGVISPDGRTVLLGVERPERPRATDPALRDLVDEGPVPGVAGLRRDPPFDWDVVVVDVASGQPRSIGRADANLWDARFTPDGDAVVFVSDETGQGDLYRFDLDTGATTRLTDDPRLERAPVVGRRWTVFMAGSGTDDDPEQIMVLDNRSGRVVTRFASDWNQTGPDLSPDERFLCWTSKERGHFEGDIVVAAVEGEGAPRRLTPAGRDDYCQWLSADHLLYRSWRTGDEELFIQGRSRWSRGENVTLSDGQARAPFVVTPR